MLHLMPARSPKVFNEQFFYGREIREGFPADCVERYSEEVQHTQDAVMTGWHRHNEHRHSEGKSLLQSTECRTVHMHISKRAAYTEGR